MRFLFSQPIIVFPLLRDKFCPKCLRNTQKKCPLQKCQLYRDFSMRVWVFLWVSRHENQNKNRKIWRYVYRKFSITQRFNIEDTKERSQKRSEIWRKWKKLHMERHYEGSDILFLESRAQSMSLQISISFFIIYSSGSNIW